MLIPSKWLAELQDLEGSSPATADPRAVTTDLPIVSVACHVCGERLELPITGSLWGTTTPSDQGCVTLTAPFTPEFREHMDTHSFDGSWRVRFIQHARNLAYAADMYGSYEGEEI